MWETDREGKTKTYPWTRTNYDGDGLRTVKDRYDDDEAVHQSFRYLLDYTMENPVVLDDGHTGFVWANGHLLYAIPYSDRWSSTTNPFSRQTEAGYGPFAVVPDGQGSLTKDRQ